MDELITFYIAHLQSINKSPHTIKQYSIDIKQFIKFMKDNNYTFADSIAKLVGAYIAYLNETFSSSASINRKRSSLHHFLTFLFQRKIIEDLPDQLLKPIKIDKLPIQTLTINQVKLVSNYWLEDYEKAVDTEYKWIALRNFCLVNIILEIGVKPAEIVKMKWSHIKGNEITILQNKKIRKLPLSTTIQNWLRLYRDETEVILPISKYGEYVWLGLGNKQNEAITVKTIERIFNTLSTRLGFKNTATTLRYTLIDREVKKKHDEQLKDLFVQYGYSRKSVLIDRLERINKTP